MLNNDYDPFDQLEYLSNGFVELAGLLNRQQTHMESIMRHIRAQERAMQDLNMRLTNLEIQK